MYFVFFICVVMIIGALYMYSKAGHVKQDKGMIIIFNGPSSSGKTTVQKKMQAISKELFLRVGIDSFFDSLIAESDLTQFRREGILEQHSPSGELIRSVIMKHDEQGNQVVPLTIGPAGMRIIRGMHRALAAYADAGNNLIVDYILYNPAWILDLKRVLDGYQVYLIGFKGPLSVIEERERMRATSPVGHARSHYDTVHQGMTYDLVVDIEQSPEQLAHTIYEYITHNRNPLALKKL